MQVIVKPFVKSEGRDKIIEQQQKDRGGSLNSASWSRANSTAGLGNRAACFMKSAK